jgi:class 3 adenylate cyclase/tetratricopeptide (TPR) repeat protein
VPQDVAPQIPGYRLIRLIGKGGMGRVFLGEDEGLGRPVAIKVISDDLSREAETIARFRREARAMAAVEHPNIARVYSIGETEGLPYFVMQYVQGESLAQRIARYRCFRLETALQVILQVLDALEAAWERKLVHRDLKPANILIDREERVQVVDFGLARPVASEDSTTVTRAGEMVGTPAYMSPEQARGEAVDFRSDLYSLGIVLFEMLAGERPFTGPTPMAVVLGHLQDPLPSLRDKRPDLAPDVERTIRWLVSKDPSVRPESHEQLRRRLRKLATVPVEDDTPTLEALAPSPTPPPASAEAAPAPTPTPTARESRHGERRQATILVADIPGCRQLMREVDAEAAAATLSRVFDMIGAVVDRYGGTLEEAGRDHLTAVFGFPSSLEDSPREAVNAAIGIRSALRTFNRDSGLESRLLARIGIDTGFVVGGRVDQSGSQQLTLIGGPVEGAAALKEAAAEDEILTGSSTRRYTERDFEFRRTRAAGLDGYRLLSTQERLYRALADESGPMSTELIGRGEEMARLEVHLLQLLDGRGSIVSVVGPAGIGKSRLVAELRRVHSRKAVAFLRGRAVAIGEKLSFHPIADILRQWARITERDTNAQAVQKLEAAVGGTHPEGAEEVFPFIATLMGLRLSGRHAARLKGIEGDALRTLLLKALRELLVSAARARPIVIVLEDLHWADQTSIDFFESLYRLALDHRILFLNVFRPDQESTSSRVSQFLRASLPAIYEEVHLEPLDREECERLALAVFGVPELPPRVRHAVADKAEGNPFFIEEVGRALMDGGAVVRERGRLVVSDRIDALTLPETIQDVLLSRVDRLEPQTRSLIKVAAVAGRHFLGSVLADVASEIGDQDERLDELERLGLVHRLRGEGGPAYAFRHALTQEVVYGSILAAQREALHLQIAEAIEQRFQHRLPEFSGMLAYHYTAAGDPNRSEEYLIKAGEEAQRSAASGEALYFYRQAVDLCRTRAEDSLDPRKIATLEKSIALALFDRGQYGESLHYFDRALRFHGIRPRRGLSLVLSFLICFLDYLITVHVPRARFRRTPSPDESEGLRLYYRKLSALVQHDPERFFLESFVLARRLSRFDLTRVENGVGMFASSGNLLAWTGFSYYLSRRVLRLLRDKIDDSEARTAISYRAAEITHAFLAGEWETRPYDEELVTRALDLGEVFLTSNYVIFHGRLALERGRLDEARARAERLERIGSDLEHLYPRVLRAYLHSKILLKTGQLPQTVAMCVDGGRLAEEGAVDTVAFGLGALKCGALAQMGELGEAEELVCQLEETARKRRLPRSYRGDYLLSRAEVDLLRLEGFPHGQADGDRDRRRAASASCRRLRRNSAKVASHRVEAFRLSGRLEWLAGDQRGALRHWDLSLRAGEELGARLELARAYLEVGSRLRSPESRVERVGARTAVHCLRRAHDLLEEMGLERDLAALDGLEERAEPGRLDGLA